MFIRYKIKLIPIDSLKNRDDGFGEAVAASTHGFVFLISHSGYAI